MSIILPVTLSAAAAAAIINIWLMIRVGQVRSAEKISVGDEDNENLIRRMRAQANFVESTPFVLVLLAAIELTGRGDPWLTYVAGIYMIGRVAHAFGMDGGSLSAGRPVGTIISLLTQVGLAVVAVLILMGVM